MYGSAIHIPSGHNIAVSKFLSMGCPIRSGQWRYNFSQRSRRYLKGDPSICPSLRIRTFVEARENHRLPEFDTESENEIVSLALGT